MSPAFPARLMCQSRGSSWATSYLCTAQRYPGKGRVKLFPRCPGGEWSLPARGTWLQAPGELHTHTLQGPCCLGQALPGLPPRALWKLLRVLFQGTGRREGGRRRGRPALGGFNLNVEPKHPLECREREEGQPVSRAPL